MNVPSLRFKEFSDNWVKTKLENIYSEIRNGFVGIATPYYVENGIKYLQGKNIKNGSIDDTGLIYISEDFHKKYKKSQLKLNDIVMVQSGHVGECAVIDEKFVNSNCHALVILSPKNNKEVSSKFFVNYLYSPYGKNLIYKIKTGNTIEHVLASEIKELTPLSPNFNEQTKIANFLTAIDEKITQLTKKYDLLTQYKKGVMQKIFNQGLRFKNDNGEYFSEWKETILDEVLDYEQPTKYLVSSTEYDNKYKIPVLTAGKTFILGYTNETTGIYENKLPVIIFDDFTTAFKFVTFPFKAKSSAMKILKIKNTSNNIKFIYEFMETLDFTMGDEHKRYWISEYSKLAIQLPSIGEQTKIADFLTAIDEKITNAQAQLAAMKQYKQGLLQKMFV